jgi:hypothetical protein
MAKKPMKKEDMAKKPMKKEGMEKSDGLTAAQKKLPPALQAAMLKRMKKK